MSAGGLPNLRLGWGIKMDRRLCCIKSFQLAPKTVKGNTTAKGQRKSVPDSCSGYKNRNKGTYVNTVLPVL